MGVGREDRGICLVDDDDDDDDNAKSVAPGRVLTTCSDTVVASLSTSVAPSYRCCMQALGTPSRSVVRPSDPLVSVAFTESLSVVHGANEGKGKRNR